MAILDEGNLQPLEAAILDLSSPAMGTIVDSWSSVNKQIVDANAADQAKANLLLQKDLPLLSNGSKKFMFKDGDKDQWIVLDLSRARALLSIGVEISVGDRDVWDFVKVETKLRAEQQWVLFGMKGKEDAKADIRQSVITLRALDNPKVKTKTVDAQFIRVRFGAQSKDNGGTGSIVTSINVRGRSMPGTIYKGCEYDQGSAGMRLDGCVTDDNCKAYPDLEMAKAHCDRHVLCSGVVERKDARFEMRTGKNLVSSSQDTAYTKTQCFDCPGARGTTEDGYSICRQP